MKSSHCLAACSASSAGCAIIVPVIFFVIFGVFLYRRSQQGKAAKVAAQSWPGTMGTVLMSSAQSKRTGKGTSIYPVVVYQYQANGQTYQSQTIKAGDQFFNVRIIGLAQETVNRYPIGAR